MFVAFNPAQSQNNFEDIEKLELFSKESDIINGVKWDYLKRFEGHPFWKTDDWVKGEVKFNGHNYSDLSIKYDLENQELVLFKKVHDQAKIYKLNRKFIESFKLYDPQTGRLHLFELSTLSGNEESRFYNLVYSGQTACFIYQNKIISNKVSDKYAGEYLYNPVIYIRQDGIYKTFRNTRSFLSLLKDNRQQVRRFMRKNNLEIDGEKPEDIARVLKYYDSLMPKNQMPDEQP